MDEKNRNISDTFGKYGDKTGEFKNVSSSDWTPISTGGNYQSSAQRNNNTSRPQSSGSKPQQKKKNASKKQASSSKGKKAQAERGFISEGKPSDNKKKSQSKSKSSSSKAKASDTQKKAQTSKKTADSRTPSGRDMREDAKKQQKHREDLFRSGEDYKKRSEGGENHDEISRKASADKRKKNAIKNGATVAAVLIFAVFFIFVFCYNHGGLIENIIIDGSSVYSSEEICKAAGISEGKNMLSLREHKIKKELTKKLPYIKDVKLERELPDTVILTIKSTTDKYIISGTTTDYTLDTDGKVVSTNKQSLKEGLYRVDGFDSQEFSEGDTFKPSEGNAERYELMQKIVTLFDRSGVVDSAVIELKNTEDVRVVYNGKVAVYLGDCKNLEEKIPYASGILEQVASRNLGGYIDMRFELGFFKPGGMEIE